MADFQIGQVVIHKATLHRCVIIKKNDDGTIKVRDQNNQEQNYYPQELRESQAGVVTRRSQNLY